MHRQLRNKVHGRSNAIFSYKHEQDPTIFITRERQVFYKYSSRYEHGAYLENKFVARGCNMYNLAVGGVLRLLMDILVIMDEFIVNFFLSEIKFA